MDAWRVPAILDLQEDPMPEQPAQTEIPESRGHLVSVFKWPIVFYLAFTSVPAGFAPFFAAGAYRALQHEEQIVSKWRSERKIKSDKEMLNLGLGVLIGGLALQTAMSWMAWRKWNSLLFGFRGAGWFALIWCAFILGAGFGCWIYIAAPE